MRLAQPRDLEALLLLEAGFPSDRLSRRSFRRLTASPSAALLVADAGGGTIAGYALVLFRAGARSARLYSIARDPDPAWRGLGARLLAAAEQAARNRGAAELRLEVRPGNAAALRLYEASGYRVVRRRPRYYEDGADALGMVKCLR